MRSANHRKKNDLNGGLFEHRGVAHDTQKKQKGRIKEMAKGRKSLRNDRVLWEKKNPQKKLPSSDKSSLTAFTFSLP